jgi:hypothetical protein
MPFTHILANELIDYIRTTYTHVYIGAYTTAPTKTGGGSEVAGGSYSRIEMETAVLFPAASNSQTENDTMVSFAAATASWGTLNAITLHSAASGGDLLAWHPMSPPRVVASGDVVAFPVGNIIIRNV